MLPKVFILTILSAVLSQSLDDAAKTMTDAGKQCIGQVQSSVSLASVKPCDSSVYYNMAMCLMNSKDTADLTALKTFMDSCNTASISSAATTGNSTSSGSAAESTPAVGQAAQTSSGSLVSFSAVLVGTVVLLL